MEMCSPRGLLGGGQTALLGGHVVEVVGEAGQDEGDHGSSQRADDRVDQAVEGECDRNEPQHQRCTPQQSGYKHRFKYKY